MIRGENLHSPEVKISNKIDGKRKKNYIESDRRTERKKRKEKEPDRQANKDR